VLVDRIKLVRVAGMMPRSALWSLIQDKDTATKYKYSVPITSRHLGPSYSR
jgi:hypothetical protein